MIPNDIVLGGLFGDEGKGKCVQYLVKQALDAGEKPIVVRYSGGPQSAHTIHWDGVQHICSSFGAGVLLGVDTMYIGGYFDPICFVKECEELERKGVKIPNIYIHVGKTGIITPYDVLAQGERETTDGTCGKGIYRTYHRIQDSQYWGRSTFLNEDYDGYIEIVKQYYHIDEDKYGYDKMFMDACASDYFQQHVKLMGAYNPFNHCDHLIFEGTQGLLLDMDRGFYPNVTPSRTGLNGIRENFLPHANVYLCTRTYLTRHGNGYMPQQPIVVENPHETNVYNEHQGEFKTGMFEEGLFRRAIERHCLDVYQKKYNMTFNRVISHYDLHPYEPSDIGLVSVSKVLRGWSPESRYEE